VFSVYVYDALDAVDLGLFEASIQRKAVVYLRLSKVLWDATETEGRELLEVVIGLQDATH
jgi:hypothetical protein